MLDISNITSDLTLENLTTLYEQQVCDLPFVFFSDPDLMPALAGTLVAASYGCEQNKAVIQQELSMDMLLPSLKSCKSNSNQCVPLSAEDAGVERKAQVDASQKSNRSYPRNARLVPQRGSGGVNTRGLKSRNLRDSKLVKVSEEMQMGAAQSASETSTLMLHSRFPVSFVGKAEEFFTAEVNTGNGELV